VREASGQKGEKRGKAVVSPQPEPGVARRWQKTKGLNPGSYRKRNREKREPENDEGRRSVVQILFVVARKTNRGKGGAKKVGGRPSVEKGGQGQAPVGRKKGGERENGKTEKGFHQLKRCSWEKKGGCKRVLNWSKLQVALRGKTGKKVQNKREVSA